jgi:hypothetical protein
MKASATFKVGNWIRYISKLTSPVNFKKITRETKSDEV